MKSRSIAGARKVLLRALSPVRGAGVGDWAATSRKTNDLSTSLEAEVDATMKASQDAVPS